MIIIYLFIIIFGFLNPLLWHPSGRMAPQADRLCAGPARQRCTVLCMNAKLFKTKMLSFIQGIITLDTF